MYELFFGKTLTLGVCLFRLFVSVLAGSALGLERRIRQQVVGMRTLILICVSSCLLMILSVYTSRELSVSGNSDPARIAAQVVSGIGFLGAGTILRQGLNIKGLTSSAIIWATAALGLTIGAGLIIPAVAVLVIFILSLILIEKVEEKFFPSEITKQLYLVFESKRIDLPLLRKTLTDKGVTIANTGVTRVMGEKRTEITLTVKAPKEIDVFDLVAAIKQVEKLEEFRFTD